MTEYAIAVTYCPEESEYLILHRDKDRQEWEFASGEVEEDESPEETVLRELEEETGLEGQIVGEKGIVEEGDDRFHVFKVEVGKEDVELSDEHSDFAWIEREEMQEFNTADNMQEVLNSVSSWQDIKKHEVGVAVTYHPGKDKFLLLKRSKDRHRFPGKWEFASGFIEKGENEKDAALRELEEETGLIGQAIRTGDHFEVNDKDFYFRVHPTLVTVDEEEVELTMEHEKYEWLSLEEIEEKDTVPNLDKDLEKVGVI